MSTAVSARPSTAQRLRALADRQQAKIDTLRRPMTQNPTPKRNKEYRSRMHDGDNLARAQQALRALADAHDANTVPPCLAKVKTLAAVAPLVYKGLDQSRGGHYEVIPAQDYRDTSEAGKALQAMIDGAGVEDPEAVRQREIDTLSASLKLHHVPGFFPTPDAVIERMHREAVIKDGSRVLEPSAGMGAIADHIKQLEPDATIDVVERYHPFAELLEKKGHRVIGRDFLDLTPVAAYDAVLMNPPFENGQDIEHVRHAFGFLRDGGTLVAIVCRNSTFRQDRKYQYFRDWCDQHAANRIALPSGSFTASGTGVETDMLVIDR